MSSIMKKLLIGASVVASVNVLASTAASAFTVSGTDYLLYDANSTSTFLNPNANINSILAGNSSSPGGNIELYASSEKVNLASFLQSKDVTSVQGTVAGKSLTLSSLTATDWFGSSLNTAYGATNFANQWFNEFYIQAGLNTQETGLRGAIADTIIANTPNMSAAQKLATKNYWNSVATSNQVRGFVYNTYLSDQVQGFQRSSDPNISYVTTSGSDLLIGLAGHYDAKAYYAPILGTYANFIKNGFQVSEVVKVNYGGIEKLLYSFSATETNLKEVGDGKSHSGNYEVKLAGVVPPPPPASVPEPSVVLGLFGLGGLLAAKRKQQQAG